MKSLWKRAARGVVEKRKALVLVGAGIVLFVCSYYVLPEGSPVRGSFVIGFMGCVVYGLMKL